MFFTRRGAGGSGGEAVATRNILNGVLSCAWDKTSYSPKLLEIYENSQVKLNVDSDNPLVLAFANGWDDLDRPAQIVKRLAVAPSNIDLSAKASRHVQIVAKVINDELVITTHDIFDPGLGSGINIIPYFTSANPVDGWSVSASSTYSSSYPYKAVDSSDSSMWAANTGNTAWLQVTSPFPTCIASWQAKIGTTYGAVGTLQALDDITSEVVNLHSGVELTKEAFSGIIPTTLSYQATRFRLQLYRSNSSENKAVYTFRMFEGPTARFFRSLNKVKDRSDVEQYWINLGYATVDASGNITALNHYTDLRNNCPGGMRVEA